MGETTKYHVTDSGDIFEVNNDGSFTSVGNANQLKEKSVQRSASHKSYNVTLESPGRNKLLIVKALTEVTKLGLKGSKEVVDNAPSDIAQSIPQSEAEIIRDKLQKYGAIVSIRPL